MRYLESKSFLGKDDVELTLNVSPIEDPLYEQVANMFFIYGKVGTLVRLGSPEGSPEAPQGTVFGRAAIYSGIKREAFEHLVREGYIEEFPKANWLRWMWLPLLGLYFVWLSSIDFAFLAPVLLIVGLIEVWVVAAMLRSRYTERGHTLRQHLRGFRKFLSVAESDRYTFHEDPRNNPERFMEYVPYAVALGVEHEWAELFKGVSIPVTEGNGGGDALSFIGTIDVLEGGVGQYVRTATRAASMQSSGFGGGRSGSFGGGRVGGGGGGGGGGSW